MNHFIIRYYPTKEHYESEAYFNLNDKFYSKEHYESKAKELMYRLLYYRIEILDNDTQQIVGTFNIENFNRKQFKNR